jgi:hypothetical protein
VILAKAEGNLISPLTNRTPSNFSTPPSGGRPRRPVDVPKNRIVPKIVDPRLGAGSNPAGADGGGQNLEFDDQCSKVGIDELPYSFKCIYNLETKIAKKALKIV